MGSKMSPLDMELYRRIDEVLHYVWDPIGVSHAPEARDEYESYLPQVFKLLKGNASLESLMQYLFQVSTETIGVVGNKERDAEVSKLLLKWQRLINEKHS